MSKAGVYAVVAALLLSGCATLAPPSTEIAASRTYPDSRDAIWHRILSESARNSMFIRQADAANGVITVDREIVAPHVDFTDDSIFDWADCPWGGVIDHTLSQRVELNYVVRQERDGTTTVTLNERFLEHRVSVASRKMKWVSCQSTGKLERHLLDSLYYDNADDVLL